MYYFDAKGRQLILGLHIDSPEEAAYQTDDENDMIFSKPPSGKEYRVVAGNVVVVDRTKTRLEMENFISRERDNAIRRGIDVTSTFRVNGTKIDGHTCAVRLTAKIRQDVHALITAYGALGVSQESTLKVGKNSYFIVKDAAGLSKLFGAGMMMIQQSYETEAQCVALLDATEPSGYNALEKQLRQIWGQLHVKVTI